MVCRLCRKYFIWILNALLFIAVASLLGLFLLNSINRKHPALRCEGNLTIEAEYSHKYHGDTISATTLLSTILILPFIEFILIEWFTQENLPKNQYSSTYKHDTKSRLKRAFSISALWYRDFFFGIVLMLLVNDVAKTICNQKRPHYIDTCKPIFTKQDCNLGWVEEYKCTNLEVSQWRSRDAHKSFPSGHSALGWYCAVIMIIYQHYRLKVDILGQIFVIVAHLTWLCWAIICSFSRISDHRHFPRDVLIGSILGVVTGYLTVRYLCNFFKVGENKLFSSRTPVSINANGAPGNYSFNSSNNDNTHDNQKNIIEMKKHSMMNGAPRTAATAVDLSLSSISNSAGKRGKSKEKRRPSLKRLLSTQSTFSEARGSDLV